MKGDVKARIVRSDGIEMTLGKDWRITELENWAQLSYSVQSSEIPSLDGAIVKSKRVKSQDRSITAVYTGANKEQARADAIAFFNPKYTYEVHVTYMGRTRWCKGEQIGFKASEENIYQPVSIDWTILCPNPYLIGEDIFGKDISQAQGRFGFPWVSILPVSKGSLPGANVGAVVSIREYASQVDIENSGDVPGGVRIIITPRENLKNPKVTVNNGWVRLLGTFSTSDTIEIDTINHPPKVLVNNHNAMNKADRKSQITSMQLLPGKSVIKFDADEGKEAAGVLIYYNKQYLGV